MFKMCNIQIQALDFEFSSKLLIYAMIWKNIFKTMNYILKTFITAIKMILDTSMI